MVLLGSANNYISRKGERNQPCASRTWFYYDYSGLYWENRNEVKLYVIYSNVLNPGPFNEEKKSTFLFITEHVPQTLT